MAGTRTRSKRTAEAPPPSPSASPTTERVASGKGGARRSPSRPRQRKMAAAVEEEEDEEERVGGETGAVIDERDEGNGGKVEGGAQPKKDGGAGKKKKAGAARKKGDVETAAAADVKAADTAGEGKAGRAQGGASQRGKAARVALPPAGAQAKGQTTGQGSAIARGRDPVLCVLVAVFVAAVVAVLVMAWQRVDVGAAGGREGGSGPVGGRQAGRRGSAGRQGPPACFGSMESGVLRDVLDGVVEEGGPGTEWVDGWVEDFVAELRDRAAGDYGKPMVLLLVHELGRGVGDAFKFRTLEAFPSCREAKCVLNMDGSMFSTLLAGDDAVADLRGNLQGSVIAKLTSEGGRCGDKAGSVVAMHNVERMHPKAMAALVSGMGDGGSYTHFGNRVSTERTLFLLTAGVPADVWRGPAEGESARSAERVKSPWKARERRVRTHLEGLWATPDGEADTAVERALWSRIDYVAFRAPPEEPAQLPEIPVLE